MCVERAFSFMRRKVKSEDVHEIHTKTVGTGNETISDLGSVGCLFGVFEVGLKCRRVRTYNSNVY